MALEHQRALVLELPRRYNLQQEDYLGEGLQNLLQVVVCLEEERQQPGATSASPPI